MARRSSTHYPLLGGFPDLVLQTVLWPLQQKVDIISILTATIALGGLIRAQSRALCSELREGLPEAARERAALRDRMESQNSDLRDRLGRIEGYLDLLREFFVSGGRGTVA